MFSPDAEMCRGFTYLYRLQIILTAIYFCKDVAGVECCRIFDPTNKLAK